MYKIDRRGRGAGGGVQKSFSRNIPETDPKYSEIPLHFLVFEGFPIILEKKKETDPNTLLGPFPC